MNVSIAAASNIIKNLVGMDIGRGGVADNGIESYLHPQLSLFVPINHACAYSVSAEHTHPAYSFVYAFDGWGEAIIEGQPIETHSDVPMLWSFSPNIKHQEIMKDQLNNYIAIFIDRDFFEQQVAGLGLQVVVFRGRIQPADESMLLNFYELMEETRAGLPAAATQCDLLILRITVKIIRLLYGLGSAHGQYSDKRDVQAVLRFIARNYREKLSIKELSAVSGRSESNFIRFFKQNMAMTPVEYLNQYRIEKAKQLLRLGRSTITEIAYDSGFSSSSYFCTLFKRETGLSPLGYQTKFRKQNT